MRERDMQNRVGGGDVFGYSHFEILALRLIPMTVI